MGSEETQKNIKNFRFFFELFDGLKCLFFKLDGEALWKPDPPPTRFTAL